MTSQTWRSPTKSIDDGALADGHQPTGASGNRRLLRIKGGDTVGLRRITDARLTSTPGHHTVVADLRMVPNQPLRFHRRDRPSIHQSGREEDEMIAYTWTNSCGPATTLAGPAAIDQGRCSGHGCPSRHSVQARPADR